MKPFWSSHHQGEKKCVLFNSDVAETSNSISTTRSPQKVYIFVGLGHTKLRFYYFLFCQCVALFLLCWSPSSHSEILGASVSNSCLDLQHIV